jgi:GNAT superfamily N-acetyltransferase
MSAPGGMSDYEIVPYEPKFRDALLELQSFLWGKNQKANAAYLDWKYFQNPYAGVARIYLALHDGKVVAMRGLFGTLWEVGTPPVSVNMPCAADLVIAPEHRGRGVFTKLMEHIQADESANDACPYLLNLSAGTATRLGSLTMGWRSVGPLPVTASTQPADWWGRFTRTTVGALGRVLRPSSAPFLWIDRHLHRDGGRIGPHVFVSDEPRPEAMAQLVRRLGHDGRVRHRRDESYFEWRFRQPRAVYRFFFRVDDGLDAYLVLHSKRDSGGPVTIVDCESVSPGGASELLTAALRLGVAARVSTWSCTLSAESRATLRRLRFVEWQAKGLSEWFATVLVKPTAPTVPDLPWLLAGRDLLKLDDWDLRQIYSDGF